MTMSDYDRIATAIEYIVQRADNQPALDDIAAHIQLSPYHFQRLFSRWVGVTPKRFLQVLTVENAKQLLTDSRSLLDVSLSVGLSSGSRLYDHFVQVEAVTPGEFKTGGRGMEIEYAVQDTPFGETFMAKTRRGICNLEFTGEAGPESLLADLCVKWPHATLKKNPREMNNLFNRIFRGEQRWDRPLPLHVTGTNFQIMVWKAILQIPPGQVASYSQVAQSIGRPNAARAVGTAIGDNPIAFLIPCHRVIQKCGKLGGYKWGETRMHAVHAWEAARYE